MKFHTIALATVGLAAAPAQAAVAVPSIETIETRLCPVGGVGALRLGQPEEAQDPALRRAFSGDAAPIAPFTESTANYTQWSDRLSAVEFRGASPDGDDNDAFVVGMIKALEAGGWTISMRKMPESLLRDADTYEKVLATADGPRLMMLQFAASGAVELHCGDFELLRLSEDEALEWLAPGSPRPVMPKIPAGRLGTLRPEDCAKPEIRGNLDQLLEEGSQPELTGAMDVASALDRYQTRLKTWLRWKIVASGKANADALWKIEEKVAPLSGQQLEKDFGAVMEPLLAHDKVGKKDDPEAKCRVVVGVLAGEAQRSTSEAARLAKVNAALEAEANRLGVKLD